MSFDGIHTVSDAHDHYADPRKTSVINRIHFNTLSQNKHVK